MLGSWRLGLGLGTNVCIMTRKTSGVKRWFSKIAVHVVKMNVVFVQVVKMGPPSRCFETRWIRYSINGKSVVRIRKGVDLWK